MKKYIMVLLNMIKIKEKNEIMAIQIEFVLAGLVILMGIFVVYLISNMRKVKAQRNQIHNFNELRRAFVDADTSMIFLKDDKFKYVFVNKAMEKFFNKTEAEIIGKDDYELSEPELANLRRQSDQEVLDKGTKIVNEVQWGDHTYQATKFPVKLTNGNYGIGAYIKDVTKEYLSRNKLEILNKRLKENETKLQLILDSTAEAIYGIDIHGQCTFCNKSCLRLLHFESQDELLDKETHWLFHHSRKDGSKLPLEECRIMKTVNEGTCEYVKDEVFWRKDVTCFDVEYYSYPQYDNGKLVGAVVTFIDITERKKVENEMAYLSYHDTLTGLYNRRYIEEEISNIDVESNLPISIIMGDVNGLKQMNDIFGHSEGDKLIQKIVGIMKKVCTEDQIIARTGGDEFIIILLKTNKYDAMKISNDIKLHLSKEQIKALTCSISLGYDTKNYRDQSLIQTMESAEENMYAEKTLDRKKFNNHMIKDLIKTFHETNPSERIHAKNVRRLCVSMGRFMQLSKSENRRLKDAGFLHDIGKIVLDAELLNKNDKLSYQDRRKIKQHTTVGFRILNSSDNTMEMAKYILCHHERWDGSGYPRGLKGESIPKLSRIIALAESYDAMTNDTPYRNALTKEEAIKEILKNAGSQFDPEIAQKFVEMLINEVNEKN